MSGPQLVPRTLAALLAAVLCATTPAPARAAGGAETAGDRPHIGGFGLGDGLEGLIDPRDGSLALAIPVAGLALAWDSSAVGADRHALGPGWRWRIAGIDPVGGLRIEDGAGRLREADASSPSGLLGYELADLAFRAETGMLPERSDGVRVDGEPDYAYVLHELGGRTTYYATSGAPLAQVSATGERVDWRWQAGPRQRLTATISADGIATRLHWSARQVRVEVGSHEIDGPAWRIRFDARGVTSVTDPVGGVVRVGADGSGLVGRVDGPSGASTLVDWDAPADAVPRVRGVTTTDAEGRRLSSRSWAQVGAASATGWPRADAALGIAGAQGYRTRLGDGATQVVSTFDAEHRLVVRAIEVTTGSGTFPVQEQRYAYPRAADGLPDGFGRPVRASVVFRDASGASRTVDERYVYDGLGRLTRRTGPDGTTTTTVYDDVRPAPDRPPIGAAVEETVVAADGSTSVTRRTLTPERTAAIADERLAGASTDQLVTVARTEFEVRPDGFVTEQRDLPLAGGAARITRWSEAIDRARGELTVTETRGAGTAAASTSARTLSLVHGGVVREVDPLGNTVTHGFDAAGRPTERTDAVAPAGGGEPRATTTRYRYDAFDRLVGSSVHDGADAGSPARTRTDYELGVAGDLVAEHTVNEGGAPARTRTYRSSPRGELVGLTTEVDGTAVETTAVYDAAGNLVGAHDGTAYAYDAANRRIGTTTPDGVHTTTRYWADGTRRDVRADSAATTFYWAGAELVNEAHDGGAAEASAGLASFLIAAGREARTGHADAATLTSYLGADRHGSVVELTDEDGRVTERYAYTDWGEPIGAGGTATAGRPGAVIGDVHRNPFGFAGEQHDADGLQHLRARDYDPVTRRLLTEDPVPGLNAYGYADADPVMRIDPSGRTSSADALNVGLAVAGAAFAVLGLVVGGVALTPFAIAASVVSLLDTAVAVAEVVNVAAPQLFSPTTATALAALSATTGTLTFVFGVRSALRGRGAAATSGPPQAHVRRALGDADPEEFRDGQELADLVTFFRGDHASLQAEFLRPIQSLAALDPVDRATEFARFASGQIPLQGDYARLTRLLMSRPVLSMSGPPSHRVRVTVWDALVAGAADRLPLPGDVVRRIRVYTTGFDDFVPAAHRNAEVMAERLRHMRAGFGWELPASDHAAALRIAERVRGLSDDERALQRLAEAEVVVDGVRDELRQVLREAF